MEDIQHGTGIHAPEPDPGPASVTPPPTAAQFGRAAALAMASVPGAQLAVVDPPAPGHPWFHVRLRQPEEARRLFGTTAVHVSPDASTVLLRHDAVTASPALQFMDLVYPLHTGEAAGLGGRLLTLAAGLSLVALVLSSLALWLRRRPRRR